MPPIRYHSSRKRYAAAVAACGLLVAGGVLGLAQHTMAPAMACLGILLFTACGVTAAIRLVERQPRIVVDIRGICDHTQRIGIIPWSQITRATPMRTLFLSRFIRLELRDPERLLAPERPAGPLLMGPATARRRPQQVAAPRPGAMRRLREGTVLINVTGVRVDPQQLLELIETLSALPPIESFHVR
jgi:hypothetical protein